MAKIYGVIAALLGLLATALGAYGAHGLPGKVSDSLLVSFNTAVQYQFLHVLALLVVALALKLGLGGRLLTAAGAFFVAGMAGFSGSIYMLVFGGSKIWGPITPIGGLMLMIGWGLLAATVFAWESDNE
ncbi:DUF423 domain-containing protein [Ferrimonas lipolytica]|uniref:DUF423 domain-containing protein n=1 Tax=Ferrimonas lipolytica TaxID=2724191 RepID=A0A6H1UDD8_9GAMM|nr:DUF423 domain-containing protein [Ferrimonas lipolytica]QIZ77054.1 DUF423 domain-containing protein [Ferrimonas lipolytica]